MHRRAHTIHLVLSISAPGQLRTYLSAAGRDELVIGFPDCLALGPINPPAPGRRARWFERELGERGDWDWLPRSVQRFWRAAMAPDRRRVIWTSSRSAEEHAAFLACVERFQDEPFEVVDLADVEIDRHFLDGRITREKAVSLARVGPETFAREALPDLARPLRPDQKRSYLEQWHRLKEENSPLRIVDARGLRSAPISHFDEALLASASAAWQPASSLIARAMLQGPEHFIQVGYPLPQSRVAALIHSGDLEARISDHAVSGRPAYMNTEVRRRR